MIMTRFLLTFIAIFTSVIAVAGERSSEQPDWVKKRLVIMLILAHEAATAQHAGTDEPRGAKHELRELQPFNGTGSGFRLERYD